MEAGGATVQSGEPARSVLRRSVVLLLAAVAGLAIGVVAGVVFLGWSLLTAREQHAAGAPAGGAATLSAALAGPQTISSTPVSSAASSPARSISGAPPRAAPTAATEAPTAATATAAPTSAGAVRSGFAAATATTTATPRDAPHSLDVGAPAFAAATASHLTLAQKVGQMLMLGFDGTDGAGAIASLVQDRHAGNIVLLGRNVRDPLQLRELTDRLQQRARPANGAGLLVATDQEGGEVQRLRPPFFSALPSARQQAAAGDPAQVQALGLRTAKEMLPAGINMDLAPVLDVNDNPANPVIGAHAFGVDPQTVSTFGLAFAQGLQAGGVAATAKHFPGHGATGQDSHVTLPFVNKTDAALRATELPPFAAAVRAGVDAIMVAHVVYPAWDPQYPASLSRRIVTDLLRGELGYQGVVISDDMNMAALTERWGPGEAAVLAVQAGVDMLLIAGPPAAQTAAIDAITQAVRDGRIAEARIDASVERILALKRRLGVGMR